MQKAPITVGCGTIEGVDAVAIQVEATMRGASGTPLILGRVDPVVREAYHRIMSAFSALGIGPPRGVPTINFAPAHLRKTGSAFDLPMALALAGAAGLFPPERAAQLTALGELTLQGAVLPARGAVAIAIAAARAGRPRLLCSPADAAAACRVPGVRAVAVASLRDAIGWLRGDLDLPPATPHRTEPRTGGLDLADIRGHETPKLALMIAAAGHHNLLLVGPPGSGKSALLRRLPGLLEAPDAAETLEILKIHTIRDAAAASTPCRRPLRAPHHTSSAASLLGGGPEARPGEVTLAHHGVLFLDELAEFRREALEGLRQPLEAGVVTIGRARHTVTMPADFLLVAAMNPCPCGYFGHPSRPCCCGPAQRRRYAARVSGPLLDRIDLQVQVPALDPAQLRIAPSAAWSTGTMRQRVRDAAQRQHERRRRLPAIDERWNGRLADRALEAAVGRDCAVLDALDSVLRTYRLSGRTRVRLLRIARTLADLEGRERIAPADVVQAARLRGVEQLWQ